MKNKYRSLKFVYRFLTSLVILVVLCLSRSSKQEIHYASKSFSGRNLLDDNADVPHYCEEIAHKPAAERCEFAQLYCTEPIADGMLNYMTFRYCHLENHPILAFFILGLWTFVLFYLLGNTAEDFFCPSLTKISDTLKLSPTVAGVTLLALGNGASDIATILVGIFNPSVSAIGIGEPIGAGAFNITILLGTISLISPTHLSKWTFLRDFAAFFVAILAVYLLALDGEVFLWEGIVFLVIYFIYVLVVTLGDKKMSTQRQHQQDSNQGLEGGPDQLPVVYHPLPLTENSSEKQTSENGVENCCPENHQIQHEEENHDLGAVEMVHAMHHHQREYYVAGSTFKSMLKDSYFEFIEIWTEKTKWWQRTLFVFEIPFILPRHLSIPNADESCWNKLFAVLVPIGSLQFLLFASQEINAKIGVFPIWTLFLIFGMLLSFIVFKTSEDERPPKYHFVFVIFGFVCSVAWIYLSATELVSVVASIGTMFGMSTSLLGVTVLAIGNSVADFVPNVVVAKQGYPSMAVAASYAGPVLNLLLGLGISLTASCAISFPDPFPIQTDSTVFVAFYSIFAFLGLTLVVLPFTNFHVKKWFGAFMIFGYIVFMIFESLSTQQILF